MSIAASSGPFAWAVDAVTLEAIDDIMLEESARGLVVRAARLVALVGRSYAVFLARQQPPSEADAAAPSSTACSSPGAGSSDDGDDEGSPWKVQARLPRSPLPPRSAAVHASPVLRSYLAGLPRPGTSLAALEQLHGAVHAAADALHELLFLLANCLRFNAYNCARWDACAGEVAVGAKAWLIHATQAVVDHGGEADAHGRRVLPLPACLDHRPACGTRLWHDPASPAPSLSASQPPSPSSAKKARRDLSGRDEASRGGSYTPTPAATPTHAPSTRSRGTSDGKRTQSASAGAAAALLLGRPSPAVPPGGPTDVDRSSLLSVQLLAVHLEAPPGEGNASLLPPRVLWPLYGATLAVPPAVAESAPPAPACAPASSATDCDAISDTPSSCSLPPSASFMPETMMAALEFSRVLTGHVNPGCRLPQQLVTDRTASGAFPAGPPLDALLSGLLGFNDVVLALHRGITRAAAAAASAAETRRALVAAANGPAAASLLSAAPVQTHRPHLESMQLCSRFDPHACAAETAPIARLYARMAAEWAIGVPASFLRGAFVTGKLGADDASGLQPAMPCTVPWQEAQKGSHAETTGVRGARSGPDSSGGLESFALGPRPSLCDHALSTARTRSQPDERVLDDSSVSLNPDRDSVRCASPAACAVSLTPTDPALMFWPSHHDLSSFPASRISFVAVCDEFIVCVTYAGLATAFKLSDAHQRSSPYAGLGRVDADGAQIVSSPRGHFDPLACMVGVAAPERSDRDAGGGCLAVKEALDGGWAVPAAAIKSTALVSESDGGIIWPHVFLNLLPTHGLWRGAPLPHRTSAPLPSHLFHSPIAPLRCRGPDCPLCSRRRNTLPRPLRYSGEGCRRALRPLNFPSATPLARL